ncbi:MAG: branched-chain amino acid ABC transporter permease [Pseudomonadota bacterium]
MMELFGMPSRVLFGQLSLGLINGSFYAVLSLGLAVIFGLLHVINFAHGALYMLGAFLAWMGLEYLGIGYWWSLALAPLMVALGAAVFERTMLRRLYRSDALYGLLLTYGLALVLEGTFRNLYGVSGLPYDVPETLQGGVDVGFMFLPLYRVWVVVVAAGVCIATWLLIEKTRLGSTLRAATERAEVAQGLGVNVPLLVTATYASGAALAALAGVLAAPLTQVNPLMGSNLIVVVFAVVVIGGMGSIGGSVMTGLALGVVEGLTKAFWPEASAVVVFVIMAVVLVFRPAGLFGKVH